MLSTKHQEYTYTLKTAARYSEIGTSLANCGYIMYAFLQPPDDVLTIESLNTHLTIKFEDSVPVEYQVIKKVGIVNTMTGIGEVTYKRTLDVNKQADANRVVDLNIDLSSLIKRDNVEMYDGSTSYPTSQNYVYVELDTYFSDFLNTDYSEPDYEFVNEVMLWKIDALYTIKKIR